MNNRAMVNICVTLTFPAIPDLTFDLVIATKSYASSLMEAAEQGADVDIDDIANEIYSKKGRHLMASFKSTLESFGIPSTGDYYIVADRAAANVAGFKRHYLCCWPHQLDRAFKWALEDIRTVHPSGDLITSLGSIRELTTYCKSRSIVFKIKLEAGGATTTTSPSNPSKTRWLGLLRQVNLYLKAKAAVLEHAHQDADMQCITEQINWDILEA